MTSSCGMPAIDKKSDTTGEIHEPTRIPRYLTVAELRLFNSDDPTHDNDFDEYPDTYSDDFTKLSDSFEEYSEADPLACLDDTLDDEAGEICELHVYENRYNSRGLMVTLRVGAMDELPAEILRNPHAALVLVRTYDQSRTLKNTTLEIRSPYMRKALQDVIGSYPGVNLDSVGIIQISGPDVPRCLFHYRQELHEYAEASNDDDIQEHVGFLLKYMARAMHKEMSSWQTLMESSEKRPGLEYADLWMAYRPGDLLFSLLESDGGPQICRLRNMEMTRQETGSGQFAEVWVLYGEVLDCTGEYVSYADYSTHIPKYDGYRPLGELLMFPLRYHSDEARIRDEQLKQSKYWLSLVGVHHRSYTGLAQLKKMNDVAPSATAQTNLSSDYDALPMHGGIIIDPKEYSLNVAPGSVGFIPGSKLTRSSEIKLDTFTDDEILCCHNQVYAFSLVTKRWGRFYMRNIKDVEYNAAAFDSLVIPAHQKSMIRSLVNDHQNEHSNFDDLVKGKGKGLIFLLHGPPGVGKTLTAESLADFTRRPLYTLGCGDLGTNGVLVEKTLTRALQLASKWNALILVDEADVFMEERNNWNLAHNELVAVLLRALEYFEGVMFLTTNRVGSIDTAFRSRIHLSLYYPKISPEARSGIWKAFILLASGSKTPAWLDNKLLDRLTSYDINGRQIKNTIRMACSIAANDQRELQSQDILNGLEALTSFEMDFGTSNKMGKVPTGGFISSYIRSLNRPAWINVIVLSSFTALATRAAWVALSASIRWWRRRRP